VQEVKLKRIDLLFLMLFILSLYFFRHNNELVIVMSKRSCLNFHLSALRCHAILSSIADESRESDSIDIEHADSYGSNHHACDNGGNAIPVLDRHPVADDYV